MSLAGLHETTRSRQGPSLVASSSARGLCSQLSARNNGILPLQVWTSANHKTKSPLPWLAVPVELVVCTQLCRNPLPQSNTAFSPRRQGFSRLFIYFLPSPLHLPSTHAVGSKLSSSCLVRSIHPFVEAQEKYGHSKDEILFISAFCWESGELSGCC